MEIQELKGLVIFSGMVIAYSFVLFGCMAQRLNRIVRKIEEEDEKYVD